MVSRNLLFFNAVTMADSDDAPNFFDEATLSVAEVNDRLPGPGLKIETVLDFKISWVREALTAMGITVDDLSNKGRCRAALIKHYETPNKSASKAKATKAQDLNTGASGGGPPRVDAPPAAFPDSIQAIRGRGVLLKAAPRPNKTAGLHWTVRTKPGLALMAESLKLLMGLIGKAWSGMLYWINEHILSACPEGAVLGVEVRDLEVLHLAISVWDLFPLTCFF